MSAEILNETEAQADLEELSTLASFLMDRLHIHPDAELAVTLVDDEAMEELHQRWMGLSGTTDVMSFPLDELRPGTTEAKTPAAVLGDIMISPSVAAEQAEAHGHSLEDELCLLLTHGFLHLLGFDHDEAEDQVEMFGLQRELLAAYLGRTPPTETVS